MDIPVGILADLLDGAVWHRSSYSGTQGNCVEVTVDLPGVIAVRDSKDPEGPKLIIRRDQWVRFISRVRTGEFEFR
jgi:Domain of unknown function (DUF397)